MKITGDLPYFYEYAVEAGQREEPSSGEMYDGFHEDNAWPAKKVNFLLGSPMDAAKQIMAGKLGTIHMVDGISSLSGSGSRFISTIWDPYRKYWLAISDTDSGNLFFSLDGCNWDVGASYNTGGENPIPHSLCADPVSGFIMFTTLGAGSMVWYHTSSPLSSGASFTKVTPGVGASTDKVYTRLASSRLVFTGSSSLIVKSSVTVGSYVSVTGVDTPSGSKRIAHYANGIWFGFALSVPVGYVFFQFSDDPANAVGSIIYNFTAEYPDFVPTAIDVDEVSGRVILLGYESPGADKILKILVSDDMGANWEDATIERGPIVLSDESGLNFIQNLGGSCWFARTCNGADGSVFVFASVDGGLNWFRCSVISPAISSRNTATEVACYGFDGRMLLFFEGRDSTPFLSYELRMGAF